MGNLVRVYIDESLKEQMAEFMFKLAEDIKKRYKLKEVTIPDGFTSQVLASQLGGGKFIEFKIRKTGLNKGVIYSTKTGIKFD